MVTVEPNQDVIVSTSDMHRKAYKDPRLSESSTKRFSKGVTNGTVKDEIKDVNPG